MQNVIGLIVSYIYIGIIIISAKFFEKAGKEASRKYIHIMLSNWWLIAMFFFKDAIWASIGPLSFIVINYISYKKNVISVMEREKQDGLGTVYYAVALFLVVIFTFGIIKRPEIGLCAIFIMGYGDGLAAVIGQAVNSYKYKIGNTQKSAAGSATMFFISFIIIAIFLCSINASFWLLKSIILSILLTVIEAVSIKGTDNITVPVLACLLITLMAL